MTSRERDRLVSRERDRAVPIDADRLVEMLREDGLLDPAMHGDLLAVARALAALLHHEQLGVKRRLRRGWRELDRDGAGGDEPAGSPELAKGLLETLRRLLQRANFVPVSIVELHAAMRARASIGVSVDLDLDDYEAIEAWRRRVVHCKRSVPRFFGLRRRTVDVELFDRFCLYARFKPGKHFAARKSAAGRIGVVPGGIVMRLFRDVPRHDVEALFPGVRVRMRQFDRALIGVPAVAGALHFLVFKIGTSLGALGLALLVFLGLRKEEPELRARALGAFTGLAVLLAFLFRQWMRFLGRKNLLHRQLAEHLQACTLDSGIGVVLHLLDEAGDAEFAEALLAYAFLAHAKGPLRLQELDARVEEWLARRASLVVDFEQDDAVAKLERLGLVERRGEGLLSAVAPRRALERLETRWKALLQGP